MVDAFLGFVAGNLTGIVLFVAIVANLIAAILNVAAFLAHRRRLRRVIQRERRLDAGPVTSAVADYARGGASTETQPQPAPEGPIRRRRTAGRY